MSDFESNLGEPGTVRRIQSNVKSTFLGYPGK